MLTPHSRPARAQVDVVYDQTPQGINLSQDMASIALLNAALVFCK